MQIIVQKFGGTSVATEESREKVIEKIKVALSKDEMPVVVVSAIGRKGSPYATDTLIDFVSQTAGEMTDREYDMLLACGEIISAVTMATKLNACGIRAKAFTGGQAGIITDCYHKQADLICAKPEALLATIEEGIIPVVAGFQGMTIDGEVTTLGRGGSDTTASMLGGAIRASRIEIFTDVDGIMTADPRICEKANFIPAISYTEVFQMADNGAKVIHPRAVEYAMRANIPLVIKNTFSEAEGTFIVQSVEGCHLPKAHTVITSVANRNNRVQFTIEEDILAEEGILEKIADAHISIDLINIFPKTKMFTIDSGDQGALEKLLKATHYKYSIVTGCAKVTAIGERMTGVPGVMARIIKALAKANIEVLQTADSLTTIACLIKETEVSKAINVLHDEFKL